jgi:hypothetical protein
MQEKSDGTGNNTVAFRIEAPSEPVPSVSTDELSRHFSDHSVSISLKYYSKSCECFSLWQPRDLKKFSATIEKISGYTPELLKSTYSLCVAHKGEPNARRFSRPSGISEDVAFHEIKVDPSNKARIHGFFAGSVFFLVWLDRAHECFPQ